MRIDFAERRRLKEAACMLSQNYILDAIHVTAMAPLVGARSELAVVGWFPDRSSPRVLAASKHPYVIWITDHDRDVIGRTSSHRIITELLKLSKTLPSNDMADIIRKEHVRDRVCAPAI